MSVSQYRSEEPFLSATRDRLLSLRDSVERLLDSEKVLPANGQALLEMLRRAEVRLAEAAACEAVGLLLGFETLLGALVEAGILDRSAGDLCVEQARSAAAALKA